MVNNMDDFMDLMDALSKKQSQYSVAEIDRAQEKAKKTPLQANFSLAAGFFVMGYASSIVPT